MKVQSIYNSKILKKGLEFAATKSSLFVGSVSFALSTVARPVAIMAAPDTNRENKKYACTKSLASSAVGYALMVCASLPVSNAVEKIKANPSEYLKTNTLKNLSKQKKFAFVTQLFNLGLGFLIAVPKSVMTCALIPPMMSKIFPKKSKNEHKEVSFTGNLSKGIGKLIDTKFVQNLAEKFHDTKFEHHIICLTDAVTTGAFIEQTRKSKKIEEDRKKALMYNAGLSTGFCIAGSYVFDKFLKKTTEKFVENFKIANKDSKQLGTYLEGIKVAKPALIMGGLYYIAIPFVSTFLADRFDKN